MKRLWRKAVGLVHAIVAAVIAFGNWKQSPLHRRVCGPDAPFPYNLAWMMNGRAQIESWPAKLCGCTPPPGYSDRDEWRRVLERADISWRNQPEGFRRHLESYGLRLGSPK